MNCHAARALLDYHAERRLTPRREQAVVAHLASCAGCFALSTPAAVALQAPSVDFKARLAAVLKSGRQAPVAFPSETLTLWPEDLFGVAIAAAALAVVAVIIGWSGVPTQQNINGDQIFVWRMP